MVLGFVKQPQGMKLLEKVGRKHRERSLRDPELIERRRRPTTPSAASASCRPTTGIRRCARDNVELVTEASREVRARSIVTARGRELEVDALVFGTGFHVVDMPVGRLVRGRDGRSLAEALGRLARARTSARRSRASRTSSSCSARTPGSGTARWST